MKRLLALLCTSAFALFPCAGQSPDRDSLPELILAFKSKSPGSIADQIDFPLKRRYPLHDILDKEDFMRHYKEVLDDRLIDDVANSDPEKDWEEVGWRGIQFKSGEIWLTHDCMIRAINHESRMGERKWKKAIEEQRRKLPRAYRDFDIPIYEWETRTRHYRLDRISDEFRLMVWSRDNKELVYVLENGKREYDGNMGFFHIDWVQGSLLRRIQNQGVHGEWKYHYLVYYEEELARDEDAGAIEIDAEVDGR